jgi:diguanylate cyclase (GGDEF)-like protein
VVARLGGDEFVVLVQHDVQAGEPGAAAGAAAVRLQEAVARHNATSQRPFQLSISLGFSAYDPAAPQGIEVMLDAADQQMYVQKREKRLVRAWAP